MNIYDTISLRRSIRFVLHHLIPHEQYEKLVSRCGTGRIPGEARELKETCNE